MPVKYTNIFHSKALKNLSKLVFLLENEPSGNPAQQYSKKVEKMSKFGNESMAAIKTKLFGLKSTSAWFDRSTATRVLPFDKRLTFGVNFFSIGFRFSSTDKN
jgi:hypothetical protein